MSEPRYPLSWPTGWPRISANLRRTAPFNKKVSNGRYEETKPLSVADATDRLQRELDLLRAKNVVLSTNMELRLDGRPRSDRAAPTDPGAAVYFIIAGKATSLACDKWDRVADNIAAIAKHIEALRGMDRWGVGSIAQAFAGYQALPNRDPWWTVLDVPEGTSDRAVVEVAYRSKAKTAHPDQGGQRADWDRLQAAYEAGKAVTS